MLQLRLAPTVPVDSSSTAEQPIGRYPSPSSIAEPYPLMHPANAAVAGISSDATVDPAATGLEDAYRYPFRTPSDKQGYLYKDEDGSVQYAPALGPAPTPNVAGQVLLPIFTAGDLHYCAAEECSLTAEAFTSVEAVW